MSALMGAHKFLCVLFWGVWYNFLEQCCIILTCWAWVAHDDALQVWWMFLLLSVLPVCDPIPLAIPFTDAPFLAQDLLCQDRTRWQWGCWRQEVADRRRLSPATPTWHRRKPPSPNWVTEAGQTRRGKSREQEEILMELHRFVRTLDFGICLWSLNV